MAAYYPGLGRSKATCKGNVGRGAIGKYGYVTGNCAGTAILCYSVAYHSSTCYVAGYYPVADGSYSGVIATPRAAGNTRRPCRGGANYNTGGVVANGRGGYGVYGNAATRSSAHTLVGIGYGYGKSFTRRYRGRRYGKGICCGSSGGAANVPGVGIGSGGATAEGGHKRYAAAGTHGGRKNSP